MPFVGDSLLLEGLQAVQRVGAIAGLVQVQPICKYEVISFTWKLVYIQTCTPLHAASYPVDEYPSDLYKAA